MRPIGLAAIGLIVLLAMTTQSPVLAADAACAPGALAATYPGLVGKTLKVSVTGTTPPYSFRDPKDLDRIVGFGPDYARAAFACIGTKISFGTADWSGLVASVVSGQADLIWDALFYTPERAKALDFVTYQSSGSGALVPKGNPKHLHALSDLCGLHTVALIGSVEDVKLHDTSAACEKAGKPPVTTTTTPDRAAGLRLVENGRADAYVGEATAAAYDKTLFDRAFTFSTGLKIGVAVAKGNTQLEHAVYDAIKRIQASGAEKALYEKYGMDSSLSLPPEILTR